MLRGRAPYERALKCLLTTVKAKTSGTFHGGMSFSFLWLIHSYSYISLFFKLKPFSLVFDGATVFWTNVEVNPVNSFHFNHSEVTKKACVPSVELHKAHQGWLNDLHLQVHYSAWKVYSKGAIRNSSFETAIKYSLLLVYSPDFNTLNAKG